MAQVYDIKASDLSDLELFSKIKSDSCSDSFTEIKSRYDKAYYKICQKYKNSLVKCGINPSDIYNDLDIVLLKCIQIFDPSRKVKFVTLLCNYARYNALNSMKCKHKFFNQNYENDLGFLENMEDEKVTENARIKENYQDILSSLNRIGGAAAVDIFMCRYVNSGGNGWAGISKRLNLDIDSCKKIHDYSLVEIQKHYNNKNYEQSCSTS